MNDYKKARPMRLFGKNPPRVIAGSANHKYNFQHCLRAFESKKQSGYLALDISWLKMSTRDRYNLVSTLIDINAKTALEILGFEIICNGDVTTNDGNVLYAYVDLDAQSKIFA